jgi:hypothetical protein
MRRRKVNIAPKIGQIRVLESSNDNTPDEPYIITVLYLTDMSRETFKNLPDWYNDKVLDEPPD